MGSCFFTVQNHLALGKEVLYAKDQWQFRMRGLFKINKMALARPASFVSTSTLVTHSHGRGLTL